MLNYKHDKALGVINLVFRAPHSKKLIRQIDKIRLPDYKLEIGVS